MLDSECPRSVCRARPAQRPRDSRSTPLGEPPGQPKASIAPYTHAWLAGVGSIELLGGARIGGKTLLKGDVKVIELVVLEDAGGRLKPTLDKLDEPAP